MKRTYSFMVALLASVTCVAAAHAVDPNQAVLDKEGRPVKTETGGCVNTMWDGREDPCAAPKRKEQRVVSPEPARPLPPRPKPPEYGQEQRSIYFDFNKDNLTTEGKGKLDALANAIRNDKEVTKATIVGYADEIGGNSSYNLRLSEQRAENVMQYLGSRISVPVEKAQVRGLGATNSQTDCPAKMKRQERISCLSKDRRVEVELTFQK